MKHARSAARLLLAALAAMLLLAATPAAAQTTTPDRAPEGLTTIVVRPSSYDALTKIAVPDTYNLGDTDPRGLQLSMAKTIRTCLGIAGFFNVLSPDRYFFDSSREGITAPPQTRLSPASRRAPREHPVRRSARCGGPGQSEAAAVQ